MRGISEVEEGLANTGTGGGLTRRRGEVVRLDRATSLPRVPVVASPSSTTPFKIRILSSDGFLKFVSIRVLILSSMDWKSSLTIFNEINTSQRFSLPVNQLKKRRSE